MKTQTKTNRNTGCKASLLILGLSLFNFRCQAEDSDDFNPATRFDTIPVHYATLKDFFRTYIPPEETYKKGSFDCRHYAKDLIADAHTAGIRASLTIITITQSDSHAVVAFPTADAGLVYADATPANGKQSSGVLLILLQTNAPIQWISYTNAHPKEGKLVLLPKAHAAQGKTNVLTTITVYPQQELYHTNQVWLTRDLQP